MSVVYALFATVQFVLLDIDDLFSKFSQYIESFSFNQYNVLSPYNLLYSYDVVVVCYVLNAWQSLKFNLGDSNKFLSNLCQLYC